MESLDTGSYWSIGFHLYDGKPKCWDLLDWVYWRSCICSKMLKQRLPCIGLEIGLGHILCVISFDVMTNLSIGIWNWIGVYLRPCLSSKVPKQGCPCIELEVGFGHILRVISFIDIDMMASLSIGLGYI